MRSKKISWTISFRLTLVYAILLFTAIAAVNISILLSVSYYINQTSSRQLRQVADSIAEDIRTLNDISDFDLSSISSIADNVDINLFFGGKTVYSTEEKYVLTVPGSALDGKATRYESGETTVLYLNKTIPLEDGGILGIQIIKDMDNEENYLHALTVITFSLDGISLILAFIAGYLISRKALSPIDKIIEQAKQIGAGDLAARIHLQGPDDELMRLSVTFNDMLDRIQRSYEKQKRFTMDASHELATPLSVIKGYTDLMDRWGKNEPAVLDEAIRSIQSELSNMTALMDVLLLLSKGDHNLYKPDYTEFPVRVMIGEIIRESALVDPAHPVVCDNRDEVAMHGDRRLIKQMLRALVDNSMKYSARETPVELHYEVSGRYVVFTVSDHGIGIPREDLPHIFERFYRVDKARSRETGGSGLGLSIVKWIADLHGGSISVSSESGKGTIMTVMIPLGE